MYNNFETLNSLCKRYYRHQALKILLPIFLIIAFVAIFLVYTSSKAPKLSKSVVPVKKKIVTKKLELTKKKSVVKKAVVVKNSKTILTKKSNKKMTTADRVKTIKKEQKKKKILPKNKPVKKNIITDKAKITKKKKDIVYTIKANYHYIPKTSHVQIKRSIKKATIKKVKPKRIEPKSIKPKKVEQKKVYKPIKLSSKNIDSMSEMLELFKNKESYSLALQIAKKYYFRKEYAKALLWSKKANILNKEDAGSWILYAKARYAQGRKKRAIEILRLYLANKSSVRASMLLNSWEKESK